MRTVARLGLAALLAASLAAFTPALAARPLDGLARDVERAESVRAIKTLQRTWAQFAQFGLWRDMVDLSADDGQFIEGDKVWSGRERLEREFADRYGDGKADLPKGAVHTLFVETPLINLSPDGRSAKGRWHVLAFLAHDGKASIEGGIFENDYVQTDGVWKIATLHYYRQYQGPYETGWTNVGGADLPLVPYHYTPDTAGLPIAPDPAPPPRTRETLASLAPRIDALNSEDQVRNLQSAYGYYVDRKMWDDIVDLFERDGTLVVSDRRYFRGKASVRRALELMGPPGLKHGELNDHPQFDTTVAVMPNGREAYDRGVELGQLGEADQGKASWRISVFRNQFVKSGGVWRIRELRVYPQVIADYREGWGKNTALDPVMAGFLAHPTPSSAALPNPSLADARRRLARSTAYDGVENVASAYGDYLDDFQSPLMGALFAPDGFKVSAFAGYYVGPERITKAALMVWGDPPPVTRPGISFHWRIQPVIMIASDGRSANVQERLFQPRTSKKPSTRGDFYAAGFWGGMYHDQYVLDGGAWRMWNLSLDEPYFSSSDWKGGWAAVKDPPPPAPGAQRPPSKLLTSNFLPDVPAASLGAREEHFLGGTGQTLAWPSILPMWFDYRNPVSGRVPEHYWPDCVPCVAAPQLKLTSHGYLQPPNGPEAP